MTKFDGNTSDNFLNSKGFSLLELLFALVLFSFGLTALVQTHTISAFTLKTSQERYQALLIARQCLDSMLASDTPTSRKQEIYQNKILYVANSTYSNGEATVDIRWRQFSVILTTGK